MFRKDLIISVSKYINMYLLYLLLKRQYPAKNSFKISFILRSFLYYYIALGNCLNAHPKPCYTYALHHWNNDAIIKEYLCYLWEMDDFSHYYHKKNMCLLFNQFSKRVRSLMCCQCSLRLMHGSGYSFQNFDGKLYKAIHTCIYTGCF